MDWIWAYLNTRGQFVTRWCRQTQRNICGSSVQLNIEKYLVANYMSFSTDKPWASCQLLKLWYSLESKQMGSVCLGIPQEISYFRTTAVGWDPFATTKLSPSHCRPQPGINENSTFTLCPQIPLSVWPIPRCFNLAVFIKSANTRLHFNQELQWNNLNCWPRWYSWSRWLLSPIQPKIFYSTLLSPTLFYPNERNHKETRSGPTWLRSEGSAFSAGFMMLHFKEFGDNI